MVEITKEEAKSIKGKLDIHPTHGIRVLYDRLFRLRTICSLLIMLIAHYQARRGS